jgi:hypothetical protein
MLKHHLESNNNQIKTRPYKRKQTQPKKNQGQSKKNKGNKPKNSQSKKKRNKEAISSYINAVPRAIRRANNERQTIDSSYKV